MPQSPRRCPCAVTSTDVAFASPCSTLVAICETNAMNGEAMPIVSTITTNIRRITGWAIAKRRPSARAPKIGRRSPSRCGTLTSDTATITAKKLIALHHSAVPIPPMEIAIAANDGPDDPSEVPLRVRQADTGDEVLALDEIRQDRLERRERERPDAAGEEAEHRDAERRRVPSAHPHREDRGHDGRERVADDQQSTPAPSIGHRRADRAEYAVGQEAGSADDRRPRCLAGRVRDVVAEARPPPSTCRRSTAAPPTTSALKLRDRKGARDAEAMLRATLPVSLVLAWRPGCRCLPAFRIAQSGTHAHRVGTNRRRRQHVAAVRRARRDPSVGCSRSPRRSATRHEQR